MPAAPACLVLLDLDGTLADSAPGITASAAHAFRTLGLPVPDSAALRRFVGPPITTSFARHGVPTARMDAAVDAYRSAFAAGGLFDASVYPGVPEQLARLREAGCTLVVATSKPTVFAIPVCEHLGLDLLVDAVHGASLDESRSSKALVIAEALEANRPTSGPVLMVGDREHDVHGAAAHGLDCVGVAWGYAAPGELTGAGAIDVVARPEDLAASVLRALGCG